MKRFRLIRIDPPNGHTWHASRKEAEATLRAELPDRQITRDARGRYVDQDGNRVAAIYGKTPSAGGRHSAPRRQVTAPQEHFDAMDELAGEAGIPWSQWLLGLGMREVEKRKRKRPAR